MHAAHIGMSANTSVRAIDHRDREENSGVDRDRSGSPRQRWRPRPTSFGRRGREWRWAHQLGSRRGLQQVQEHINLMLAAEPKTP
jgi:hypothetical protein